MSLGVSVRGVCPWGKYAVVHVLGKNTGVRAVGIYKCPSGICPLSKRPGVNILDNFFLWGRCLLGRSPGGTYPKVKYIGVHVLG